jgi:hypothetical protein
MRSQNGLAKADLLIGVAKANLLNMHTKALIRPFDKGRASEA